MRKEHTTCGYRLCEGQYGLKRGRLEYSYREWYSPRSLFTFKANEKLVVWKAIEKLVKWKTLKLLERKRELPITGPEMGSNPVTEEVRRSAQLGTGMQVLRHRGRRMWEEAWIAMQRSAQGCGLLHQTAWTWSQALLGFNSVAPG